MQSVIMNRIQKLSLVELGFSCIRCMKGYNSDSLKVVYEMNLPVKTLIKGKN